MFDDDGESTLERALLEAYPDASPVRYAMPNPGKHEIAGCIAIRLEKPVPHWLVVSRGFGFAGAIHVRLFCPAEVIVLRLVAA